MGQLDPGDPQHTGLPQARAAADTGPLHLLTTPEVRLTGWAVPWYCAGANTTTGDTLLHTLPLGWGA